MIQHTPKVRPSLKLVHRHVDPGVTELLEKLLGVFGWICDVSLEVYQLDRSLYPSQNFLRVGFSLDEELHAGYVSCLQAVVLWAPVFYDEWDNLSNQTGDGP